MAQDVRKIKGKDLINFTDSAKRPTIINIWATWCLPCIQELNYFEKVVNENKNIRLVLLSVDYANDYSKIFTFLKARNITAETYWLDEFNLAVLQTDFDKRFNGMIPATLMINNSKQYRSFHAGQLSEKKLRKEIDKLIN